MDFPKGNYVDKRYQVFVSSTYQDLQVERQEVMHALLELDCIPSGMELFPAANETQWNLIKRVIDDCDYYILIIGGRYGSIGPEGKSFTEMEYRYALSIAKPTIAFLHRDPGKIPADYSEPTEEGREKLKAFRTLAENKLCKHWDTPQTLGSVVSRSLIQLIKTTPAIGWVRANELPDKEATIELLQLRRRVDELQAELSRSRVSAPQGTEQLSQGDDEYTLEYTYSLRKKSGYDEKEFSGDFEASWNDIYSVISPLMIHEASDETIRRALNAFVKDWNEDSFEIPPEYRVESLTNIKLHPDDFNAIKVQLRALGLIVKNDKPRSVKDPGTYWTLTPYGDNVMTKLLAIRKEDAESHPDG